jgi:hypothetical protein
VEVVVQTAALRLLEVRGYLDITVVLLVVQPLTMAVEVVAALDQLD